MKGLDISQHQTGFSLQKAIDTGISFVILRGAFTGWGTGVSYNKDTSFETFYKEAKALNLPTGVYHYSCANTYEKGIAEAEFLYNNCLEGKKFEMPIYIDVEESRHQTDSIEGVTKAIKGFCEYLELKGYYVGLYANVNYLTRYIDTESLTSYDKWLAKWQTDTSVKPTFPITEEDYGLWQYSSSEEIAGTRVDTNICYKDYPSIIKYAGLNGYDKGTTDTDTDVDIDVDTKEYYTVKSGDTLSSISRLYNCSYMYLYDLNKTLIDSENIKRGIETSKMWIYPNQILLVVE